MYYGQSSIKLPYNCKPTNAAQIAYPGTRVQRQRIWSNPYDNLLGPPFFLAGVPGYPVFCRGFACYPGRWRMRRLGVVFVFKYISFAASQAVLFLERPYPDTRTPVPVPVPGVLIGVLSFAIGPAYPGTQHFVLNTNGRKQRTGMACMLRSTPASCNLASRSTKLKTTQSDQSRGHGAVRNGTGYPGIAGLY
eukprot:399778-Rhodomonas_salina.1